MGNWLPTRQQLFAWAENLPTLLKSEEAKKRMFDLRLLKRGLLTLGAIGFLLLAINPLAINTAQADDATFTIKGYRVDGPANFSEQQLAKIFAPYVGEGQNFESLRAAQQALTAAYLESGFGMVNTSLPPQESKDGYITITVKPLSVGKIILKGNDYHDEFNILNAMPALQSGQTMNPSMLARQLRLNNENPSKQASVVLTAAQDDQIDAEVTIADQHPWKAFATYDNTGTDQTGRSRVSVGFQNSNLFDRDQVLTAQYTSSPNNYNTVSIWGLGYQIPIYAWAHDINFYAAYSDVDSGTLNNLLNISSKGYVYGVRYQLNFANRGLYKDKLAFGLEYRDLQPSETFFGSELAFPLDLHPFTLSYTGSYTDPGKLDANFYLAALHNIPGGSIGQQQDFTLNRLGATAEYKILRAGGTLIKVLPAGWYARLQVSGQYTNDLLVNAEQFGIGGEDSIRGFEEREVSNDKGLQLQAELYTLDWYADMPSSKLSARGVAFFDAGRVWRNDPLPGEQQGENISSAGLGVRLGFGNHASLKLDYAHVLAGTSVTKVGSDKLHVLLVLSY